MADRVDWHYPVVQAVYFGLVLLALAAVLAAVVQVEVVAAD